MVKTVMQLTHFVYCTCYGLFVCCDVVQHTRKYHHFAMYACVCVHTSIVAEINLIFPITAVMFSVRAFFMKGEGKTNLNKWSLFWGDHTVNINITLYQYATHFEWHS